MLQRCSGGLRGLKLFYTRSCKFPVSEADKMDDTGEYFSGGQKTKLERGGKIWGPDCCKIKWGGGGELAQRVGVYAGERQRRQTVGGGG